MIYAVDGSADLRRALFFAMHGKENASGGVTIRAELPGGGVILLDPYQVSEEGDGHIGIFCHKIDLGEPKTAEPVVQAGKAQGGTASYQLRSALRRLEAVMDLLDETALAVSTVVHKKAEPELPEHIKEMLKRPLGEIFGFHGEGFGSR